MTRLGCDYAWGRPSVAALRAAGVTFVLRYVSTVGNTKNLDAAEAARLRAGGIDIGVVFENSTGDWLGGFNAGRLNAMSAAAQTHGCGAPADDVLYFAIDSDPAGQLSTAVAYLNGARSYLGVDRTGVYGSYSAVKACLDAKVVTYTWQTRAWSGGLWEPRTSLRQYGQQNIDGVSCDVDEAFTADFGQWDYLGADVPLTPDDQPVIAAAVRQVLGVRSNITVPAGQTGNDAAYANLLAGQQTAFNTLNGIKAAVAAVSNTVTTTNSNAVAILAALTAMHITLSPADVAQLGAELGAHLDIDPSVIVDAVHTDLARTFAAPSS